MEHSSQWFFVLEGDSTRYRHTTHSSNLSF